MLCYHRYEFTRIQNRTHVLSLFNSFSLPEKAQPGLALTVIIELKLTYDDSGLDPYRQEPLTFSPLPLSL